MRNGAERMVEGKTIQTPTGLATYNTAK